jgi:superfamily I DNA/RNA helicase
VKPLDIIAARGREFDLTLLDASSMRFVYFLFLDGELTYIGRTKSLVQRMGLHASQGREFDRSFWIEVPEQDAPLVEGAFIRRFDPPECHSVPKDFGRDAEILARFGLEPDSTAAELFESRRVARVARVQDRLRRERKRQRRADARWARERARKAARATEVAS